MPHFRRLVVGHRQYLSRYVALRAQVTLRDPQRVKTDGCVIILEAMNQCRMGQGVQFMKRPQSVDARRRVLVEFNRGG